MEHHQKSKFFVSQDLNGMSMGDSLCLQKYTQTEIEEIGKYIPCKWKPKENRSSYIYRR